MSIQEKLHQIYNERKIDNKEVIEMLREAEAQGKLYMKVSEVTENNKFILLKVEATIKPNDLRQKT